MIKGSGKALSDDGDVLYGLSEELNVDGEPLKIDGEDGKKDTLTAIVCRQTRCYEGMLIGDDYAIKGNVEEVKGEKKR